MKAALRVRRMFGAICLGLLICASGLNTEAASPTGKAGATEIAPVDINRATAEELTTIPGIGPATAARVIAFRDEHGPFKRTEDLLKIRGIGEKSFQKLRPYLVIGKKSK